VTTSTQSIKFTDLPSANQLYPADIIPIVQYDETVDTNVNRTTTVELLSSTVIDQLEAGVFIYADQTSSMAVQSAISASYASNVATAMDTSSLATIASLIQLSSSTAIVDTIQYNKLNSLIASTASYLINSQTSSFASGSDVIKLFASSASSAVIDTVQTSQISSLSIATSSYVQNSQTSSMTVATSSLSTSSSYAGGVLLNNIINLASGNVAPLQHAPDTSTGLVTQTGGDARYIPQGGTLTSTLNLGGHVLAVAMPGDVIATWGSSSLIGIDTHYNPYLQNANGTFFGFDSAGNVSFAGFSLYNRYGDFLYATGKIFADSSGNIYYNTGSKFADSSGSIYYATGNKFADFRGNIYYATGNTFADFRGNIYYATGNTFADYYGSIYYNTGNVFVDYSSNIYYATGNTFADFHGNIYYNTGNKLADSSGNLFLRGGLYDSFNSSGSAGNFLSNNGSGKAVWGPVTVALAGITDMSFTARTANTAAVNTSGGIVTMGTVTTLTPTGASPAITINLALGHTFIIATSGATGTPTILFSNIPPDAWCNIYVKQGTTALNATFPTNTVQAGGGGVTYTATGASTNDMIAVTFLDSTHPVIAVTRGYN
jgi:hypothetical protein